MREDKKKHLQIIMQSINNINYNYQYNYADVQIIIMIIILHHYCYINQTTNNNCIVLLIMVIYWHFIDIDYVKRINVFVYIELYCFLYF